MTGFPTRFLWALLFECALLFLLARPLAAYEVLGETSTTWPGVKFQIVKVIRLDSENVLMAVILASDSTAACPTVISNGTTKGTATPQQVPSLPKPILSSFSSTITNGSPKGTEAPQPNFASLPKPIPFSLSEAFVIDELSHKQFNTIPSPRGQPTFGPTAITTTMAPNNWFQMSVQFNLPVPPPDLDGKVPVQKVDVSLPRDKGSIKGLIVPPLAKK